MPLYLLQNCTGGYVGNSPVFWSRDGSGYTQWIDEAKWWTKEEADKQIESTRGSHTWHLWSSDEIAAVMKRTVDIQNLRNIAARSVGGDRQDSDAFVRKPDTSKPSCPDCVAVDCDRARSGNNKCSSGFAPGQRKVCDMCGRMMCPTLYTEPVKPVSHASPSPSQNKKALPQICHDVADLEAAVSYVTEDCRLVNPVLISYEMQDGEGLIRAEPSVQHMFHRLWTMCVASPNYNKADWQAAQRQLDALSTQPTPA